MSPDESDRLEAVFLRHAAELTRFARRRVGADAAADIVSSTFLVACRRLDDMPAGNARPWLYAIARLVIANELRGRRRREQLDERVARTSPESTPDEIDAITDRLRVHAALARLSELDQEALRLTEWEQLSAHEAAQVLGCTVIAFKARLHRARRRFTAALRAEDSGSTRQVEISRLPLQPNPVRNVSP